MMGIRRRCGFFGRLGCVLMLMGCLQHPCLGADADGISSDSMRVGLWWPIFSNTYANDAETAIQVWFESWGGEAGITYSVETEFFREREALGQAFASRRIDFGIILARDYLDFLDQGFVQGGFVPTRDSAEGNRYVLLYHRSNPAHSLAGLKGKRLYFSDEGYANMGNLWLQSELYKLGLGDLEDVCRTIGQGRKPSEIVLPVFFKKQDACLIGRSDFDLMVELNPQVGRDLRVIAESEPLIPVVLAYSANYPAAKMERMRSSLLNLHTKPSTLQILNLHRLSRVTELGPVDLKRMQDFFSTYEKLKNAATMIESGQQLKTSETHAMSVVLHEE